MKTSGSVSIAARVLRVAGLAFLIQLPAPLVCRGELTQRHLDAIKRDLAVHPLFKDMKLGDVPVDVLPHWVELESCVNTPIQLYPLRNQKGQLLRQHVFDDLKEMNWMIANAGEQPALQTEEGRRKAAVRYCHLLFCLSQCYDSLLWKRYELDSDFAHTGWKDAAACRWMQNYMTVRSWLGVKRTDPAGKTATAADGQGGNGDAAQAVKGILDGGAALTGGRSVKDIEAAIRRQRNYIRDLERQLDRASADYSSTQSSERERYARDGRPTNSGLINGALRRVHNCERYLRNAQNRLEELERELESARSREQTGTASVPQDGADAAPAGGRFCTQCGAKAGPEAKFCGACGAKLDRGNAP